MTVRKEVSIIQNKWSDAQRVDQNDMETEQNRNNQIDSAIIQNHFGSGIVLSNPTQNILFDSDKLTNEQAEILAAGNFDGTGLDIHTQPSDTNLGNQLEVELIDSNVLGRLCVKIAIIGLSFDNTLQMERLYFHVNEKQVTSRHYKKILTIFTNDFKGNNNCSRNLSGRIIIRETSSFQLSSDPIMVSQDVEPDIFWRDFKVADISISLFQTIQNGIGPEYSVDDLNINTSGKTPRKLLANDVTTQIGQKFLATTNNIQKITLLLGVDKDSDLDLSHQFDWEGDLIISVYALQNTTNCPTDIIPSLAIDFDPSITPLAQLSYSQETLKERGYVLTDIPQPIDFIFNNTKISKVNNSFIEKDKFYAVTLKRSGAANSGSIFWAKGTNTLQNSSLTVFNNVWVDIPEECFWFQIWTDACKISDGIGYDNGIGISFAKTITDSLTGSIIDYQANKFPMIDTGENILNIGVLQASSFESTIFQDEKTGNDINSRKIFVPSFSFVTQSSLEDLEIIEPLILGCMQDTNPKINPTLDKIQNFPGLVKDDNFCIINPDADLLSLNLLGSKLIPDLYGSNLEYKIAKVTYCTDGYGDVNGDGQIDELDINLVTSLIGESYYYESTQQKINDGYISILELLRADVDGDGYVTSNDADLITNYVNKIINSFPAGSTFTHICYQVQSLIGREDGYYDCGDGYVRLDGYLGIDIVNISDLSPSELIYDGVNFTPQLLENNNFTQIPFMPITFRIKYLPYWQPYLLLTKSDARKVPCTFTFSSGINIISLEQESKCLDKNKIDIKCDPGRNDFYIPYNLYIDKGQILKPDGSHHAIDFEVGTVILQLPQVPLQESAINIFEKFVADRGDGLTTRAGYPVMRYADKSPVQLSDLAAGKIRFNVSLQSFTKNIDGYSEDEDFGLIIDNDIGMYLDQNTGILKLTIKNLNVDSVYLTLVSRIQIIVYLKKAGWNNTPLIVNTTDVLGLISS